MKKNLKKNMYPVCVGLALLVSMVAASAPARADDPAVDQQQQSSETLGNPATAAIVDMSWSMLKTVVGKALNDLIFPSSIDYGRIRQDMQDVTRQVITEAEITKVEGLVLGADREAQGLIADRTMSAKGRYDALKPLREPIARSLDSISQGMYAKPGLAHYVSGAQAELSILTAMKTIGPEASQDDGAIALRTLRTRLKAHLDQVVPVKASILQDRYNERVAKVNGCTFRMQDSHYPYAPLFAYYDTATGQVSDYIAYELGCKFERDTYLQKVGGQAKDKAQEVIGWIDQVVENWKSSLNALPPGGEGPTLEVGADVN